MIALNVDLSVFPYINQMLLEVGAAKDPEAVGYAAGIVSSLHPVREGGTGLTDWYGLHRWRVFSRLPNC